MPDVFISYSRKDKPFVGRLAHALQAEGLSVWWDADLVAGTDYERKIRQVIADARRTVVVWSPYSLESGYVTDEANLAKQLGKLVPVAIGGAEPRLGFGTLHTLTLSEDLLDIEPLLRALRDPHQQAPRSRSARVFPAWLRGLQALHFGLLLSIVGLLVAMLRSGPPADSMGQQLSLAAGVVLSVWMILVVTNGVIYGRASKPTERLLGGYQRLIHSAPALVGSTLVFAATAALLSWALLFFREVEFVNPRSEAVSVYLSDPETPERMLATIAAGGRAAMRLRLGERYVFFTPAGDERRPFDPRRFHLGLWPRDTFVVTISNDPLYDR